MKTRIKVYKRGYLLVIAFTASFLLLATGWIARQAVGQGESSEGFKTEGVRFDESVSRRPTPKIPKTWRLVGISTSSRMNGFHLWFQDKDGNIYVVQGVTMTPDEYISKFYFTGYIGKISSE